jgi:phage terminase small subunit
MKESTVGTDRTDPACEGGHLSTGAAIDRREAFVHAYLGNGRNGTQAAIAAGFAPRSAVVTVLSDPNIRRAVDTLTEKMQAITGLTTERVLRETARVAFFDVRRLYNADGG